MPAVRTPRRDIVIQIPRQIILSKRIEEKQKSLDHHRNTNYAREGRSQSPVKGRFVNDITTSEFANNNNSNLSNLDSKKQKESEYHLADEAISTAEWNSLLIWARRQRGPQWDSSIGMWQVDQGSAEYYSFGNDPSRHTKLSTLKPDESTSISTITNNERRGNISNNSFDNNEYLPNFNNTSNSMISSLDSPPISHFNNKRSTRGGGI